MLQEVVVVGQPAAIPGDVPALLHAHRTGVDQLPERAVDAVHRAAEALRERPPPREAPPVSIGVSRQQGEQPDGAI
jgi:hypothetical protein